MHDFLNITGKHIAQLDDSSLRELIGLLCEADYRVANLDAKGITWGGDQDAADGGLDVIVRNSFEPPQTSVAVRKSTGFQVKKPAMSPSAITKEMRPKGKLRPAIRQLIVEKGAYVIVSSGTSATDTALRSRIKAMQSAVVDEPGHENLALDFLDQGRIATWVRDHPSLVIWARNKCSAPLSGWKPYENWANAPLGVTEQYLVDDKVRLRIDTVADEQFLSIEEGLMTLRSTLAAPRESVRLVGLSGVGKTRLVQALFDDRLGTNALSQHQVIYADMGVDGGLEPSPNSLATQLVNEGRIGVLVVDNCTPALHRQLTEICLASRSRLSLITVEYDVRDDLPDETSVFRLEPSSDEIIAELITSRFPNVSRVDSRTISEFSGGNARLAIAVANTVKSGDSLAGFRDVELLKRLFEQGQGRNDALMQAAEVCALLFSFDGEDVDSANSEIGLLASLISRPRDALFRDIAELKKRDLIQSRGKWRALLPHALANYLAAEAVVNIPVGRIQEAILTGEFPRVVRSFSRRLGYLHDSEEARKIVNDWLSPNGILGKSVRSLNPQELDVFLNIAPAEPLAALEALERAAVDSHDGLFTTRENPHYRVLTRLLKSIAYDAEFFDRCVKLLIAFSLSEKVGENNHSIRAILNSLFYVTGSGTHATLSQRIVVVEKLTSSSAALERELGFELLESMLKTKRFRTVTSFNFGARSRNYGSAPTEKEQLVTWFQAVFNLCQLMAKPSSLNAEKVRILLARNFFSLWQLGDLQPLLKILAVRLHELRPWNDGWVAIRHQINATNKNPNTKTRPGLPDLERLEQVLRPVGLEEEARAFALNHLPQFFELEEDMGEGSDLIAVSERRQRKIVDIGSRVAQDETVLRSLLPDLVNGDARHL